MNPTATDEVVHKPCDEFVESTNVYEFIQKHGADDYATLHRRSCEAPDWFWDEVVDHLDIEFYEPYDQVRDETEEVPFTTWYPGGQINVAHNALDRHATGETDTAEEIACIWEGEPGEVRQLTFQELEREANRVANALTARGVSTGDVVALFMPMMPEVLAALYGALKVGAVVAPIFSGYGTEAVATRITEADPAVVITADGFYRRGREVDLKETLDDALAAAGDVPHTIVYDRLGVEIAWTDDRDERWDIAVESSSPAYETTAVPADHEALLLYSSGTTGKPKGTIQTHAGATVKFAKDIFFSFDHKPGDRFFWVTDIGWIMGSWTFIGNHVHGGTVFMYEGAPDHPDPDRLWEMVDRHSLSVLGTSPTAVRSLRKRGREWVDGHDLSSLRLLGSTSEPWDPEAWRWFYEVVGNGETPIINITGGTEMGGQFLSPHPAQPLKPCTVGGPDLGIDTDIVDEDGESIADTGESGYLVLRNSCPSTTKSLQSGDERYLEEYWSTWDSLWDHGDWAQRDEDGFWFLHGRVDDTINVAGRKLGAAEIESICMNHDAVTGVAAIGVPDDVKGESIVLYVEVGADVTPSVELKNRLRDHLRARFGKPFAPRDVLFVEELPTNQSGKILRDALRSLYVDGTDHASIDLVEVAPSQ